MKLKTVAEATAIVNSLRIENKVLREAIIDGMVNPDSRGIHTPEAMAELASVVKGIARQGSPLEVAEQLSFYTGLMIAALEQYAGLLAQLEREREKKDTN